MNLERPYLVPIYNNRSGYGRAEVNVRDDILRLPVSVTTAIPIEFSLVDQVRLGNAVRKGDGRTLFAIYAGDTSGFSILSELSRLAGQGKIDPEGFAAVLLGSPDYGGIRAGAKTFGTDGVPLPEIVSGLADAGGCGLVSVEPWMVEDREGRRDPFFWLAAKSGTRTGLIGRILSGIEEERANGLGNLGRMAQSMVRMLKDYGIEGNVSAGVDGGEFTDGLSDAAVVIPPVSMVGPVRIKGHDAPSLLTLSPGDRGPVEFAGKLGLNAIALAAFGTTWGKNFIRKTAIGEGGSVKILSGFPETVVDSHIRDISGNLTIGPGKDFPPVKVVSVHAANRQ